MPRPKKPWKPRSSSIGSYLKCEYRAVQDRLFHEGQLPPDQRDNSDAGPAAALGNCSHFTLQDGLRCIFSPRDAASFDIDRLIGADDLDREEKEFVEYSDAFFGGDLDATLAAYAAGDPRIFQPLPSEWVDAAQLFGNSIETTREKVRATATLAATKVPASPDGKPWLCETLLENEYLTGHTDFLSQCLTHVGDLKTTARPVSNGWMKYEHLGQLTAYHLLTGCKLSWVLYVDSMQAAWATMVWVDWTKPGMQEYAQHVKEYCLYLMSDRIFDHAIPRLGDHCSGTWCPYRGTCYQKHMPPAGIFYDAKAAKRPTGGLTWGGKAM